MPLEILNKPGKLTDEEFAAIKRHPGDGRKLLEELGGFPEPSAASSPTTTSGSTAAATRAA